MKTSKLQKAFLMAAALLLAIGLVGCSAGSSPGDRAPAQDSLSQEQESQENGESGASTSIASGVITAPDSASQKLIYTGSMEIESEQFEEDYQLLMFRERRPPHMATPADMPRSLPASLPISLHPFSIMRMVS